MTRTETTSLFLCNFLRHDQVLLRKKIWYRASTPLTICRSSHYRSGLVSKLLFETGPVNTAVFSHRMRKKSSVLTMRSHHQSPRFVYKSSLSLFLVASS